MIVVGGGNAAMCAALAARDAGADVVVLEKAPPGEQGGNCPYTLAADSGSSTKVSRTCVTCFPT